MLKYLCQVVKLSCANIAHWADIIYAILRLSCLDYYTFHGLYSLTQIGYTKTILHKEMCYEYFF